MSAPKDQESAKEAPKAPRKEVSHYETLGVSPTESNAGIKKAYYALARMYHPDKLPAAQREAGAERFKSINEAYQVIGNDEKRAEYDKSLGEASPRSSAQKPRSSAPMPNRSSVPAPRTSTSMPSRSGAQAPRTSTSMPSRSGAQAPQSTAQMPSRSRAQAPKSTTPTSSTSTLAAEEMSAPKKKSDARVLNVRFMAALVTIFVKLLSTMIANIATNMPFLTRMSKGANTSSLGGGLNKAIDNLQPGKQEPGKLAQPEMEPMKKPGL